MQQSDPKKASTRDRRGFARAPRQAVKRKPSDATAFCLRLSSDPRVRALSLSERYCLLFAGLHYADGDGKFWHAVPSWSADVGTSDSTIRRTVRAAEKLGVLIREPYARPNGYQGSNTYRFDPNLLVGAIAPAHPWRHEQQDDATRLVISAQPEQNGKGGGYSPHLPYTKEKTNQAASFDELAALKKDSSHNVTQNQARARVAAQQRPSPARGSATSIEGSLGDDALGGEE
jgi:hypothetical protein